MLKISDDVDLKELEKYGFKKYTTNGYAKEKDDEDNAELLIDELEIGYTVVINPYGDNQCIYHTNLDTLYDLIKDGLVEKVDEKL